MAKLGQHFFKYPNKLPFLDKLSGTILEIGAGDGRLTKLLVERGSVYAVELDRKLCDALKRLKSDRLMLICDDFLNVKPFKVDYIVGNIPYYISSVILFRLVEWPFSKAYLMFQKEFGEKLFAKPGDKKYGRLTVMFNVYFRGRILASYSRFDFSPPPKVDSVLVEIEKDRKNVPPWFEELVRLLYSQKNKKVKNILREGWKYPPHISELRPRHMALKDILSIVKDVRR